MIIDKLIDKIKITGSPIVVGLDTKLEYIPNFILEEKYAMYGYTLKAVSKAIYDFNKYVIDEIYNIVPAVKPQIAMYETYGIYGIKAYIKTIEYAKEKGLIVIGDIKRGDIESTAKAYSNAHIGKVFIKEFEYEVFKQDFVTINPYLGFDSIMPFLEDCKKYEKGLFILAKTSNINSGEIQNLLVDGKPLYEKIGNLIDKWGNELIGVNGYSEVGAVVGATHREEAKNLRKIMKKSFFLVPGYGAQGAQAEDLSVCFDKNGIGAIINSSRGIIASHIKENINDKSFAKVCKEAVINMKNDIRRCI